MQPSNDRTAEPILTRRHAMFTLGGLLMASETTLLPNAVADEAEPARTWPVKTFQDLPYYTGENADRVKHKLDLYLPDGKKDFPVMLFVHGGAWVHGDKNFLGFYALLGRYFARHGVGTVVTNYRLSPGVKHPEHVKDVARAFAWTHKNIQKYDGRPDQLFICGHSAGAHLTALLATDETYLKAEGLTLKAVKGAIPISGVYVIADLNLHVKAGGPQMTGALGFKFDGKLLTEPLKFGMDMPGKGVLAGSLDLRFTPLAMVFGTDPEVRKKASPLTQVHPDCPPFLIMYGDRDIPGCDKMSEAFGKALKEQKNQAEVKMIPSRDHFSILFRMLLEGDPTSQGILNFIVANSR